MDAHSSSKRGKNIETCNNAPLLTGKPTLKIHCRQFRKDNYKPVWDLQKGGFETGKAEALDN